MGISSGRFKRAGILVAITVSIGACNEAAIIRPEEPVDESPQTLTPLVGTLAFVSTRDGTAHIYLSNPDGSGIRRLTSSAETESTPAWSPDGQSIVFNRDDGTFVVRRDGTGLVRLPVGGGAPSWLPDGQRLLVSTASGPRIVAANGSGENELLIGAKPPLPGYAFSDWPAWGARISPDGGRIVFSQWTPSDIERAFLMNSDGSGVRTFIKPLNGVTWDECSPAWSPDGKRIALLGGIFGGQAPMHAIFAVGIVDPDVGTVTPILATGTTCWDSNSSAPTTSGVAWSPDGKALAITRRTPGWVQGQPTPKNQQASVAIVQIDTKEIRVVIPDAYDPSWTAANLQ